MANKLKDVMAVKTNALFPFGDNHFIGFKPLEEFDYRNIILEKTKKESGTYSYNFRFARRSGIRSGEKQVKTYFTTFKPGRGDKLTKVYVFSRNQKLDSTLVLDSPVYFKDAKNARDKRDPEETSLTLSLKRGRKEQIRLPAGGKLTSKDENAASFECVGFLNYEDGPFADTFGILYFFKINPYKSGSKVTPTKSLNLEIESRRTVSELEKTLQEEGMDDISRDIFGYLKDYVKNL